MLFIMSAAEITRAAIDDGKDVHDHPGADAPNDRPGRLHKALELLRKAHGDVARNVGLHRNRPIPAMCDQVSPSALRIDTLKLHSGRSNETRNCSNSSPWRAASRPSRSLVATRHAVSRAPTALRDCCRDAAIGVQLEFSGPNVRERSASAVRLAPTGRGPNGSPVAL
jgi:hypothetical protein